METKPEMTLAPPAIQVLAERLRDGVVDCTEALVVRHQENIDTLERLQRLQQIGALG